MGLPEVCNSPRRTSVAKRLLGVLATPGKPQLAWDFKNLHKYLGSPKPPLLLGVPKTPSTFWGSQNPHYYLGFSKPHYYLGFSKTPLLPRVLKTPVLPVCFVIFNNA